MASLSEFLTQLATDADALGRFIQEPDTSMETAELDEADQAALRSGFSSVVHARLAGLPVEDSFALTLRSPQLPQQATLHQPVLQQLPPLQQYPPPPPLQQYPPPPPPPLQQYQSDHPEVAPPPRGVGPHQAYGPYPKPVPMTQPHPPMLKMPPQMVKPGPSDLPGSSPYGGAMGYDPYAAYRHPGWG